MPVTGQRFQLPAANGFRLPVCFQQGRAFCFILFAQQERYGFGFPGFQRQYSGQRAAAVAVVVQGVPKVAALYTERVSVASVSAEKFRAVAAVGGHRRTRQSEEPLDYGLMIDRAVLRIQIAVDLLPDTVPRKERPGDELGIL